MMKVLDPTPPKKVTFQESQETISSINKDDSIDIPVILQTKEQGREDCPPLHVSLLMNDLLLHNHLLDSGTSANIMTRKVME